MENEKLVAGLNESAQAIYENNKAKGFWDKERNVGEMLMLVTSELGEAMEAHRKSRFADLEAYEKDYAKARELGDPLAFENCFKKHIKDSVQDEIADAVIRLLDMSAGLGIDLERHIRAKVRYNEMRPRLHGKGY